MFIYLVKDTHSLRQFSLAQSPFLLKVLLKEKKKILINIHTSAGNISKTLVPCFDTLNVKNLF